MAKATLEDMDEAPLDESACGVDFCALRELKQLLPQLAPAAEPAANQQALLERVAALLQLVEADFQRQAPDPCVASAVFNQGSPFAPLRTGHTVGQLAPLLRDSGAVPLVASMLDAADPQLPEQLRVAALRFLLAAFTAVGFQAEDLSEASCAQLVQWALPLTRGDREPREAELALQRHAAGLLAVALTATPHCDEAVRSGCCAPLLRLLERAVAAFCADAEELPEILSQQDGILRHQLLRHPVQCAAGVGAYMDVLPPLAAAGGVRLPLCLLRACLPREEPGLLCDVLHWLAALMAHRRVAEALVDEAGLELLMEPAAARAGSAAAAVLACASLVPSALQRVAARPLEARVRLFQVVLRLANPEEGSLDAGCAARQKAADVLVAALAEPRLLAAFDVAWGLESLLLALRHALGRLCRSPADRNEGSVATTLLQAISTHLRALLGQRLADTADAAPLEADRLELRLATLPAGASGRLRGKWGQWERFIRSEVEFCIGQADVTKSISWAGDVVHSSQQVLALLLLHPAGLARARGLLCGCGSRETARLARQLALACHAQAGCTSEIQRMGLQVLGSCVGGGPDVGQGSLLPPPQAADQQQLREAFVAGGALWRLRDLLPAADGRAATAAERGEWDAATVVLTMRALAGLAQDAGACQELRRLQVAERVAGLLHEEAGALGSSLCGSAEAWRQPFRDAGAHLLALLTPGLEQARGLSLAAGVAPALRQLQRAAVAADSHIAFDPQELLGLIRDHLQASGLGQAAAALAQEAQLGAAAPAVQQAGFIAPPSRSGKPAGAAAGRARLTIRLSGQKRTQPQQLPAPPHPSLRAAETAACASAVVPASEAAAGSRLGSIVTAFLRQQHTAACLAARQPLSTPPPLSLLRRHSLPEARQPAQASRNVARRLLDRQAVPQGGLFGSKQTRRWLHSRYRHVRSLLGSEEGGAGPATAVCFLDQGERLLLGGKRGSLRTCDLAGDRAQDFGDFGEDASAIVRLQAHSDAGGGSSGLFLSSTEACVRLWSLGGEEGPAVAHSSPDCSRGVFGGRGAWFATCLPAGVAARDVATLQELDVPRELRSPEGQPVRWDLAVDRGGQLLLHGPALWDARSWSSVARLQTAPDHAAACAFHPAGLEAILGSEVWDLRMLRLRQCVPSLAGTSLTFNAAGDVAFASLWAQGRLQHGERLAAGPSSHLLEGTVLAVDATDYSSIWRLPLEGRKPMGCAVSPDGASLAVACSTSRGRGGRAMLFDIGRGPPQDDESDCEAGDESEAEEEPEEEEAPESEHGYSPRGYDWLASRYGYGGNVHGSYSHPARHGAANDHSMEGGPDASGGSESEGGGSSRAGSVQESEADSGASESGAE